GSASYYDFNITGSTVGISGATGTYLNKYAYLPYGQIAGSTGTIANSFTFVGALGVSTNGSGFSFMRARFYDAGTGHFASRDPLGLEGGYNYYRYALNNPI